MKDHRRPVQLLCKEEVDHDHPAGKDCEDRDEEAENSLPGDPECLKSTLGWMHLMFLGKENFVKLLFLVTVNYGCSSAINLTQMSLTFL